MSENKNYMLYALPISAENVETTAAARFGRITGSYALIYTAGKAPDGAVCLGKEHENRLTENDKAWLRDCNLVIIAEAMKQDETRICGEISDELELLEQRLREEADKLRRKGSALHGDERPEKP